jgi:hypothetical protein
MLSQKHREIHKGYSHMLVGKLWHASIIFPEAKGFFSPLNDAMRGSPKLIGLGSD